MMQIDHLKKTSRLLYIPLLMLLCMQTPQLRADREGPSQLSESQAIVVTSLISFAVMLTAGLKSVGSVMMTSTVNHARPVIKGIKPLDMAGQITLNAEEDQLGEESKYCLTGASFNLAETALAFLTGISLNYYPRKWRITLPALTALVSVLNIPASGFCADQTLKFCESDRCSLSKVDEGVIGGILHGPMLKAQAIWGTFVPFSLLIEIVWIGFALNASVQGV